MGRKKTAPCRLIVWVEEIRNLPKVNKGSGGADPFVVLEVLDHSDVVLVGGDRELYCAGCKSKVIKKALEGYVTEKFEFGVHSAMVRSGARLRIRVMDFKPTPEVAKGLAFVDIALKDLADPASSRENRKLDLMALGHIVTTFGNKTEHGEVLLGYKNPTAPAYVTAAFELQPPAFQHMEGVPEEHQISAWEFHLKSMEEQDEYDQRILDLKTKLERDAEDAARKKREVAEQEERMKFKRRMESRVKEPTKRTNWKELQDLMTNDLMRREWGYTMEKMSGVGGWRRVAGTGMQEERNEEAERDRVVKYLTYKASEKREDDELKDFVSKRNSERMASMTDHLSEWADPGGREAVTLHPGSRSLGASVCHVVPTANLSSRTQLMKQERERPKSRGSSGGGARPDNSSDRPGMGDNDAGELVWKDGITSAERISYLQRDSVSAGFDEFKEAVLRVLSGGHFKNAWRTSVELALQRSVNELGMPLFFTGHRLSQTRVQLLGKLNQDLKAASGSGMVAGTGMISHIDFEELVQKLREDLDECEAEAEVLQNEDGTPVDVEELSRRKVGISYLEKLLEDAEKNLERHMLRVAAQSGTTSALNQSQPSPSAHDGNLIQRSVAATHDLKGVKDDDDVFEPIKTGVWGLKPEGSMLRNVNVSSTATPTMTADGLQFATPAPDVGGKREWSVERINGRDWLYPTRVPFGGTRSSDLTTRLSIQQVGNMREGEAVQLVQHDSLRKALRKVRLGRQPPAIGEEDEDPSGHSYKPPANDMWGRALKISRGRMFNELDMIHNIRSLSLGGAISLGATTDRPRPDTSSTQIWRTPMTNHAMITVHPDRPGGESLTMEARFATFGSKAAFSGTVVNAPTPPDNSSMFANHAEAGGKIVLFDLRLSQSLLPTDLGFVCARQAESAGAVAAMFILESDELIIAAGIGQGISSIKCPILCLGKTDGQKLKNWIQPPLRFNEPYISVATWVPAWLLPEETPAACQTGISPGEDRVHKLVSNELVSFWVEALTTDEEGKEWMEIVRMRIAKELAIEETSLLIRGAVDPEHEIEQGVQSASVQGISGRLGEPPRAPDGAFTATVTTRRDDLVFGMDSEQHSVADSSENGMGEFSATAGTTLKMSTTEQDVVEIRRGVACIISNATKLLPRADGASRDLPGLENDVGRLEGVLSNLGFKVFAPQRNKNADEVLHFLRKIKRGFDAGGSLIGHDSLLVIFTGHTDGQNIECAVDEAGQVGSLGIQLLMELFNDNSCPGLKGKLKIFLLGLSFGHPVKSPPGQPDSLTAVSAGGNQGGTERGGSPGSNWVGKNLQNVLNSAETGGSARVYESTSSFSVPVIRTDWLQSTDGFLRDEGDTFQDHVSISYRRVPYSGTYWNRDNAAGKGQVTVDLGKVVEGIDTFAAFQQPFDDGKCTSIWLRHARDTHVGDVPPSNEWDWVNVTDTDGSLNIPLFEGPGESAAFVSGSIMGASRVFRTFPFSTRWLCIEFRNDNTHGTPTGVGLRQLKAFSNPRSTTVPAHRPGKPTWVENPAEGAGGPALNRVGPDSIYPLYKMPVYAFAGKPKAIDGAIGLPADYSLLCYSVPVDGVSHTPPHSSHLLGSIVRLLEASHHKHTFQDMLSILLQHMVEDSCSRYGPDGYAEQVRLLQRRCDTEDFPIMLSLGGGRVPAPGVPGPEDTVVSQLGILRYRHYEFDVAEPRNSVRDAATTQRTTDALSMRRPKYNLKFHPRLRSGLWNLRSEGTTIVKSQTGPKCVSALALALPYSTKRYTWQFTVGTVSVIGGTSLSVPELCIGVVARSAARRLNLEEYQLGDDAESWGIQTGSLTLYKNHAGVSQRLIGVSFGAGDVITCILDTAAGTLSFCVNGDEETVPPFTGLPGTGVVPAVSAGGQTDACVTISNCQTL